MWVGKIGSFAFADDFGLWEGAKAKSSRQGHFSPSLSQNRTGNSRFIRLLSFLNL